MGGEEKEEKKGEEDEEEKEEKKTKKKKEEKLGGGGRGRKNRRRSTAIPPSQSWHSSKGVCLLVGCLTSQQQASVSQGRICSDNFMCCHTEIEAADQTFYLTQSQYTDTAPTSASADPISPGVWRGSHWRANV